MEGLSAVRIIAASTLALAITGCTTGPPPPTAQEKSEALRAAIACMHAAAIKLDDGTSDATAVARGLKASCWGEWARSQDMISKSQDWGAYGDALFHRHDDEMFMTQATNAVLIERANRRH
jgi:hypothetical protein